MTETIPTGAGASGRPPDEPGPEGAGPAAAQDDTVVNSKAYWDNRFRTNWVSAGGHSQTRFFAMVAAKAMPGWLKDRILADNLSICDWGCAEGQGVDELSKWLGTTNITGVDISDVAIAKARQAFPQATFKAQDIDQLDEYDVMFSSNTLEHFDRPFDVVQKLARKARRFLVFLVPFQEYDRLSEHFFTFDYDRVPVLPAPGFACVACRVIDTARTQPEYWNGKQLLVTYARTEVLHGVSPSIENFFVGDGSYETLRRGDLDAIAQPLQELSTLTAQLTRSQDEARLLAERISHDATAIGAGFGAMRAELDAMRAALVQQQAELAGAAARYDETLAAQRRQLAEAVSHRDEAARQRDQAEAERDEARRLLAEARAACEQLQARTAALDNELQVIRLSRAWRIRNLLRQPR